MMYRRQTAPPMYRKKRVSKPRPLCQVAEMSYVQFDLPPLRAGQDEAQHLAQPVLLFRTFVEDK